MPYCPVFKSKGKSLISTIIHLKKFILKTTDQKYNHVLQGEFMVHKCAKETKKSKRHFVILCIAWGPFKICLTRREGLEKKMNCLTYEGGGLLTF